MTNRPKRPKPQAWGVLVVGVTIACGAAPAVDVPPNDGAAWPTLHGDLQRSGFYPRFPKPPFKVAWRKELWKELVGPRCEVIVADGVALMGTYVGRMYAWDARTGEPRWAVQTNGPIGHSPTAINGVGYFGSMDRHVYAVSLADGKPRWRFECGEGVWASPAVHDGLVLVGDREGVFHAIRAGDGTEAWRVETGDRILITASVTPDGQRIVFASEDMHAYCVELKSGRLLWKSRKMAGLSCRDYAPLIVGDVAILTTNPVKDFHAVMGENQQMLLERTGFTGKDDRYIPGTPADVAAEQQAIVEHLKAHPSEQTLYAFNLADGAEPWVAGVLYTGGLHNPLTPPCVNRKTGDVFVLVRSAYGVWDGGGEVRPYTGVGKLDLKTGRVALVNHAYPSKEAGRPPGSKDVPWGSFNTIGDETQALSCSVEYLLSNHQGFIGSLHLSTGLIANLYGKRDTYGGFYGSGTWGWEDKGGLDKARAAGQPFGLVNEWHGPARAIVSVAGNRAYFQTGSQVLCLEGKE